LSPDADLPAPAVPPGIYDEDYYRTACGGFEVWAPSGGREFSGMYPYVFDALDLKPGQTLVDIGTGRGELLAVAAKAGVQAIGIEYSDAALALASQTLEAHGVRDGARVVLADARSLPVADGAADAATLLDVVEHLTPAELDSALSEARRILKPGGRLYIHTFPNRTVYDVTYRLQRLVVPTRLRRWPADPRGELERAMHVNEQTVTSLRRALRRHFDDVRVWLGDWIYTDHVPSRRAHAAYYRLARLPAPFNRLGKGNIWADASKRLSHNPPHTSGGGGSARMLRPRKPQ
jgi:ubiquinone/menaquinone biosynthesis C-methylase UbiE